MNEAMNPYGRTCYRKSGLPDVWYKNNKQEQARP
jgi:hypothetical protein